MGCLVPQQQRAHWRRLRPGGRFGPHVDDAWIGRWWFCLGFVLVSSIGCRGRFRWPEIVHGQKEGQPRAPRPEGQRGRSRFSKASPCPKRRSYASKKVQIRAASDSNETSHAGKPSGWHFLTKSRVALIINVLGSLLEASSSKIAPAAVSLLSTLVIGVSSGASANQPIDSDR